MATLINGDGNAAVYAAQDADYYAGVEGDVTKILPVGLKMAYEIEDANTIAIKNGVIITKEGRRIQLDAGSIDEFTIPTGSQGVTKYYIIGYHLYTDSSSNQLCETFVQLMTSESETITENTFRGGSDEVYVSVYRVTQEGLALTTIESLLPEGIAIGDLDGIIGDTDISGIGDGTLTGAIDTINSDLAELHNPTPDIQYTATSDTTCAQLLAWIRGNTDFSRYTVKSKIVINSGVYIVGDLYEHYISFSRSIVASHAGAATAAFSFNDSDTSNDEFWSGSTSVISQRALTAGRTMEIYY